MPSDEAASNDEVEDAYHEYLWGEASPRSFARKARIVGAKEKGSRRIGVLVDASVDLSRYV